MNENKLVGFDPQIFKEQKQIVEALIESEEQIVFEENIENMLDYLEENNDEEDEEVEEDGEQEE